MMIRLSAVLLVLLVGCQDATFLSGRDTRERFGDGRFQLLQSGDGPLTLYDLATHDEVYDVTAWREGEDFVLVKQRRGSIWIVQLAAGTMEEFKDPDDVPGEYRTLVTQLQNEGP